MTGGKAIGWPGGRLTAGPDPGCGPERRAGRRGRHRHHRQRNLSHKFARPRIGLYLHRRARYELHRAICDRKDRRPERVELGLLSMRSGIPAGKLDGDAAAGDKRPKPGVRQF